MILLIMLAGGAAVNIAVAWGCKVWSPHSVVELSDYNIEDAWLFDVPDRVPKRDPFCVNSRGFGYYIQTALIQWDTPFDELSAKEKIYLIMVYPLDPEFWYGQRRESSGWPMLSMFWQGEKSNVEDLTVADDGLPFLGDCLDEMPLHPLFPGFIINTVFYAALLWLLWFAPFAARRMLRRRRGLCAKCAYPIGTSPVCTECGAAVALRSEGAQECSHG